MMDIKQINVLCLKYILKKNFALGREINYDHKLSFIAIMLT